MQGDEATTALIVARGVSLGYGERAVLEDVNLRIPDRGIFGLMGPAGAGKTTLLRALAGQRNPSPAYWMHGRIVDAGACDVDVEPYPLLAQKDRLYSGSVADNLLPEPLPEASAETVCVDAREMLESAGLQSTFADVLHESVLSLPLAAHKKILIARMLAAPCACLFVDEPLSDIAIADEDGLIEFLQQIGRRMALVLVLHNKQQARRLCDTIALVSNGRLAEVTPAEEFFAQPRSASGREFLRSGSSWLSTAPEALTPSRSDVQKMLPWSSAPILQEFRWVLDDVLGGAQCPGLLGNDASDLHALQLLGVQRLVSLTEEAYDATRLQAFGIEAWHFPVPDMGVPGVEETAALCARVLEWMSGGETVVFHCRAGLGRTGTLLACVLATRLDAGRAIQAVRRANPRYIQTEAQLRFVDQFRAHWQRLHEPSSQPPMAAHHDCPLPADSIESAGRQMAARRATPCRRAADFFQPSKQETGNGQLE